jgi:hypothetical protein
VHTCITGKSSRVRFSKVDIRGSDLTLTRNGVGAVKKKENFIWRWKLALGWEFPLMGNLRFSAWMIKGNSFLEALRGPSGMKQG